MGECSVYYRGSACSPSASPGCCWCCCGDSSNVSTFMSFIRGLHSSTSQLNLSHLHGIGGARRGCVADVKRVLGGI